MTVSSFQGALPAVLPFLRDNLNLSFFNAALFGLILIFTFTVSVAMGQNLLPLGGGGRIGHGGRIRDRSRQSDIKKVRK